MKEHLSTIVSKNPDLKHAEIMGILYILKTNKTITGNQLIQMTGIPKNIMRTFKTSISDFLVPAKDENIELTKDGISFVDSLETKPYKWSLLEYEVDRRVEEIISSIREEFNMSAKRDLDQFFATSASTISKAKLVHDKGMTEDKYIAFLGDDDLVSIALSYMYPKIKKIKVYDSDHELLNVIKESAKKYSLNNIETYYHDLRNELPGSELNKNQVILTDPPYTVSGVRLFLHRGIQLLNSRNRDEQNYIFLNFGGTLKNPEKTTKIQEVITNSGLLIEDRIDKFTAYEGAETVGSRSSIYILRSTPHTVFDESVLFDFIYTYEKQAEESFPYVDHYVFKILNVKKDILLSKTQLKKLIGDFCRQHSLKVVDQKVTKFKNNGLSFTYILSNSNLIVHTWPEYKALHIDLVTCSPIYKKESMAAYLSKLFDTKLIEIKKVE